MHFCLLWWATAIDHLAGIIFEGEVPDMLVRILLEAKILGPKAVVEDVDLPSAYISAYSCKFPSYPDYCKTWNLQSNFLVCLQGQKVHMTTVTAPAARRAIDIE